MLGMVRVTLSTLWPTHFREAKFHGFDISKEGVEPARREARQMGLTNTRFEVEEDITSQ
jgi:tRNA/tmRNA/rRNA uracil-C5-methylase (TrmA/RlmC/RlmD family)